MPQKHGARQSDGCVNPSFSRILTRTRFAPYALGQALLPRNRYGLTHSGYFVSLWVGCLIRAVISHSYTNTLRPERSRASTPAKEVARPHAFWLLRFFVDWLLDPRGYLLFLHEHASPRMLSGKHYCQGIRTALRILTASFLAGLTARFALLYSRVRPNPSSGPFSRRVGDVVRGAYKFGGWLFADSAGCPLGRFSHWWRSVWVSVFGERGVHTSVALASTVLLGHL